ncbi:hypothetical protein IPZ64_03230 [Streptomyces violaceoruber]|uniref:hypothetical protein n=1 Tax=Streptomyces violaceoruber TaxID=1935 RepID=UPI001F40DAC6|nr:hypothetical protein [Streptomyces violaceoruber]MCF3165941.1 hypothetical protein [Streptomyces violaceoruber]
MSWLRISAYWSLIASTDAVSGGIGDFIARSECCQLAARKATNASVSAARAYWRLSLRPLTTVVTTKVAALVTAATQAAYPLASITPVFPAVRDLVQSSGVIDQLCSKIQ